MPRCDRAVCASLRKVVMGQEQVSQLPCSHTETRRWGLVILCCLLGPEAGPVPCIAGLDTAPTGRTMCGTLRWTAGAGRRCGWCNRVARWVVLAAVRAWLGTQQEGGFGPTRTASAIALVGIGSVKLSVTRTPCGRTCVPQYNGRVHMAPCVLLWTLAYAVGCPIHVVLVVPSRVPMPCAHGRLQVDMKLTDFLQRAGELLGGARLIGRQLRILW